MMEGGIILQMAVDRKCIHLHPVNTALKFQAMVSIFINSTFYFEWYIIINT